MSSNIPACSGIYRITCVPTGRIYVGSAINLQNRRCTHFMRLRRNMHHNCIMQAAFNKYGEQSFIFEVLEIILIPEMLTAREQHWFKVLNPFGKKGFNLARIAGSRLGTKQSPEAIEKIRAINLGRKFPAEFGAKISQRQLGRNFSLETRKKIGDAQRGRPSTRIGWKPTPEAIERRRRAMIGHKLSEETKRRQAEARRGTKRSAETREKMRVAAMGHAPTNAKTFILTSPDGVEYVVQNGLPKFCKEHQLSPSTIAQVAKGHRKQHKGWTARYPEPTEE